MAKKDAKKRKGSAVYTSGMRGAEPAQDLDPEVGGDAGDGRVPEPAAGAVPAKQTPGKRKPKPRDAFSSGMRGAEKRTEDY